MSRSQESEPQRRKSSSDIWMLYWGAALAILGVLVILTQHKFPILATILMGIFCALILGGMVIPMLLIPRRPPSPETVAQGPETEERKAEDAGPDE